MKSWIDPDRPIGYGCAILFRFDPPWPVRRHPAPSPFAPKTYPDLPVIDGVRFATGAVGVRYQGRTDVLIALFDKGTKVAGVFTKSKCASAPVEWCRARLKSGKARALVANSGNANAFTGKTGAEQAAFTASLAAAAAGIRANEIFLASTGVIGEPLDAKKFEGQFEKLVAAAKGDGLLAAAKAIMTTDTYPKVAFAKTEIGGVEVTIAGIAKGAGMIAPDMATMLSFVFTDAPIGAEALQTLLSKGVEPSFNAITVDGDTSTSDTLLLFATGAAAARGAPKIDEASDRRLKAFKKALDRRASRSRPSGGEGWRRRAQIRRDHGRRRGLEEIREDNRLLDRQFAFGQDGDCGRRRQLGTDRDGGGEGGRAGRPRSLGDLVRRYSRRA